MNTDLVAIERRGVTGVLTLNRPTKRNALSRALVAALGSRLAEAVADPQIRVVILAANGPAFCAGLDLDELDETMKLPDARDRMQHDARQLAAVYRALAQCPKPTVAAVSGPAVAGGAGLVTACDLAIATPKAKFGYPEVRRGIMPAIITPMLLRLVSIRNAKHLLLGGVLVEASDAATMGIYNRVVAADAIGETVLEWARELAAGGPATLHATKQWIERCSAVPDLWIESADASAAARFTAECSEGIAAFHEKRPAKWGGEGSRE
jgi:methylglutaconyl-CoA hydratase